MTDPAWPLAQHVHRTSFADLPASTVESVRHTDGRSVSIPTTIPFGAPRNPLSAVKFAEKFRDCAGNAVRPLAGAGVDATLAAIGRLETMPDARVLLAPFAA